jgi:hypothetical protein
MVCGSKSFFLVVTYNFYEIGKKNNLFLSYIGKCNITILIPFKEIKIYFNSTE